MRKVTHWVVVALVMFLVGAPDAHATLYYYEDTYFDCGLNETSSCYITCAGYESCSGDRHGEFWYREVIRCSTDVTVMRQWRQWNGSQWVLISGPPSPSC
ncbi:MAG: hypothetical protein QOI24_1670 [Acidobacteriota bacterium]|jgi:hypothetical protein|nr:hypothetical protein [Acidobacteriota bacterium]